MKNCLIFLTNSFPFSSEEAFIEPEFPYLAEGFDKVITLAVALDKGAVKTRNVPQNADCYNVCTKSKKLNRLLALSEGAFHSVFPSETPKDSESGKNFKKRVFSEYVFARGRREFSQCEKVLKKYDFSQYDSVTVYSYWFFVTALVGNRICEMISPQCKKIKFVSRAHGYDVYNYANSLNYLPHREYLLEKVDSVHPCSIDGEKYIASQFPEFENKISHRYLGTEDGGISGMNEGCFHLVSCSRMVSLKRVERIASALALLKNEGVGKIRWTHIGGGETMPEVQKICEEKLGFMEINLMGAVPNTQVRDFYKKEKIDLFVNVSTTEGLPVSMMEAISFSIPVLATDVGGVGEIIKEGYNGIFVPSDFTDEQLAEKIKEQILSSEEERVNMRNNARSFWEENFNAQKNYTRFTKEISGIDR